MTGRTDEERVFSVFWILFGVAFYSFTIGNLQSIISAIGSTNDGLTAKLNIL